MAKAGRPKEFDEKRSVSFISGTTARIEPLLEEGESFRAFVREAIELLIQKRLEERRSDDA